MKHERLILVFPRFNREIHISHQPIHPVIGAQAARKIGAGCGAVAACLPFFVAIDKVFFKDAVLDGKPLKFAGAQQVMEATFSGRPDDSANGTSSANLAIGEFGKFARPDLFKVFATNPSNARCMSEEFLVPHDSPVKTNRMTSRTVREASSPAQPPT